jgi:AcrR family transcriptional regulator
MVKASGEPGPDVPDVPGARARILRAAAELIAEQGWGGVRTRAVAERAGVNNALIHYYFRTKEALLSQAAWSALLDELGGPTERLLLTPSFVAGLSQTVRELESADRPSPAAGVLAEILVRATRDPEMRTQVASMLRTFRELVRRRAERALAAGELPPTLDPTAVATILAALLDGLWLHRMADRDVDLDGAAAALAVLLGSGPRRPETARSA